MIEDNDNEGGDGKSEAANPGHTLQITGKNPEVGRWKWLALPWACGRGRMIHAEESQKIEIELYFRGKGEKLQRSDSSSETL